MIQGSYWAALEFQDMIAAKDQHSRVLLLHTLCNEGIETAFAAVTAILERALN